MLFRSALKGGTDDDGLVQRIQLLVYPDVARRWRNVDRWPDTEAKQRAWEVFQRLDELDPATRLSRLRFSGMVDIDGYFRHPEDQEESRCPWLPGHTWARMSFSVP